MTDLEKVLAKAGYTALPLPREKSSPTTIFSFHEGQLFVVRDPHACLPDPPLKVTTDQAADTVQFQREFSFDLKGVTSFFLKVFTLGKAKAEFEAKKVSSATVAMGGLQHETIQTGELIDFLVRAQPNSCLRDVLDKDHFTVIAALKAANFTYTFKNSKGMTIDLTLPEAEGLFKTDANVSVTVTTDGKVVVSAPRYVGVVSWKGDTMAKELEKARKFATRPTALVGYQAPAPFAFAASASDIQRVRDATLTKEPQTKQVTSKRSLKAKPKAKAKPSRTRSR